MTLLININNIKNFTRKKYLPSPCMDVPKTMKKYLYFIKTIIPMEKDILIKVTRHITSIYETY